jgi:hypothetical protein
MGPRALTSALFDLKIVGFKGNKMQAEGDKYIQLWHEDTWTPFQALQTDWGIPSTLPMSFQFNLDNSDFYLVSVSCIGAVGTAYIMPGGLGSIAGGSVSIALPSISLEVRMTPVVAQA